MSIKFYYYDDFSVFVVLIHVKAEAMSWFDLLPLKYSHCDKSLVTNRETCMGWMNDVTCFFGTIQF